jgi:hypothetical protein
MSSTIKPTPNNLTEVRFGPSEIDFTIAGATVIGQLEYDENIFVPISARVVIKESYGTNGPQAVVSIDNGTVTKNLFPALTLPANPIATSPNTGSNLSQVPFLNTTSYNGYVLGGLPVGTNGSNGAASIQNVTARVTTAAIPGLNTTNRAKASNIATLTVSAVPAWLVPGITIRVQSVGGTGYNGLVTVLTKTSTTFTYYIANSDTETTATDTAGRVGGLIGDVIVTGLLF